MRTEQLLKNAKAMRQSAAALDEAIADLGRQLHQAKKAPRDRAALQASLLDRLDYVASQGLANVHEAVSAAQRVDRPQHAELDAVLTHTADWTLVALLRDLIGKTICNVCATLPEGVADDDRAAQIAAIESELTELRQAREELRLEARAA